MDLHNQGKPSLRMKTIILLILSAFTAFAATDGKNAFVVME